jgi:chromate transport protein ChrA
MIGLRAHRLRGNLVLLLLGALATAVILLPLIGMLVRAPWSDWSSR